MLIVSILLIKFNKISLIPKNKTPLLIRNLLNVLGILFMFASVKLVPISTFFILFNTKGVMIYIMETLWKWRLPPKMHILCCLASFTGTMMVVWPSTSSSVEDPNFSRMSQTLGVIGCCLTALFDSMADFYLNHVGKNY